MSTMQDNFIAQGLVGVQSRSDGSYGALRLGKAGALIIQQAHGKYYEATSRSKSFIASIGVAGVAPGTALSTTPAFTLWNPVNSGVLVVISQVFVGYVSGTLGAGSFVHTQNTSQLTLPSGGTELVPVTGNLSGSRGVARCLTGSTISAASTLIRPSLTVGAALATSVAFPSRIVDEIEGGIIVPGGVSYSYQGIMAAGTTPLVMISVIYEEVAIP